MSVADPKCYVRLEEPIPGVDHIRYVDPRGLARAHGPIDGVAGQLGVDSLNDFYVHSSGLRSSTIPWHEASAGLAAFRAIKVAIEGRMSPEAVASPDRDPVLEVLDRLEELLARAESRGVRFCVVGNY